MPAECVSRTDCLREVYCTLALLKPLCLVFDPVRGGAPLPDLEAECDVKLQPAIFGPPDNKRDVIPWHRIKDVRPPHPPARPSRSPLSSPPHTLSRPFVQPQKSHTIPSAVPTRGAQANGGADAARPPTTSPPQHQPLRTGRAAAPEAGAAQAPRCVRLTKQPGCSGGGQGHRVGHEWPHRGDERRGGSRGATGHAFSAIPERHDVPARGGKEARGRASPGEGGGEYH